MKLSLMVTEGVHAGQVIAVNGVSLWIGRGPQCHVRPNSPAVADRHCYLTIRGERAFVRDLDSRSGTYLNDRQLRGEIELRDGDFLRVGPLVFVIQLEASAVEPSATELPSLPLAAEPQEMPAHVPGRPAYFAAETQEMPAYVPQGPAHFTGEAQEADLEPLPLDPPEEPVLTTVGAVSSPNGSRPSLARTPWGRRRRPRPAS